MLGECARDGRVNVVGGCSGTTPDHIREIAAAVDGVAPRVIPEPEHVTRYSGLEPFAITEDTNFVMIGERTNIQGSARFRRRVARRRRRHAPWGSLAHGRAGAGPPERNPGPGRGQHHPARGAGGQGAWLWGGTAGPVGPHGQHAWVGDGQRTRRESEQRIEGLGRHRIS